MKLSNIGTSLLLKQLVVISCILLMSFIPTIAMAAEGEKKEGKNPIRRWFILEEQPEPEEEENLQGGYVFGTDTEDDEEEEEIVITSGFECYDYTSDFDRAVCLNPEANVFMEQLRRQYSLRLASVPLSEHSIIQRQQRYWDAETRLTCITEISCIQSQVHKRMIELIDAPIIYRENLELKAGEPPVTIAVTGRKTKTGYMLHKIIHSITNPETGRETTITNFDLYRFMRSRYFELPHPYPKPFLIDANFDGWQDLLYFTRGFAQGIDRIYLIYKPDKGRFVIDGRLNGIRNPLFIDKYKIIASPWQSQDQYGLDYYRYKNNKLIRDTRVIYHESTSEDGEVSIAKTTYSNRTGRLVKKDTVKVDLSEVGNIPEVYTSAESAQTATDDNKIKVFTLNTP